MAKKPVKSNKVVQTLNPKTVEKTNSKSSNFLKFLKKYQKVILSFTLVLVLLVGGSLAYLQIDRNNRDNAGAGLNCPGGTVPTSNGCQPRTGKVSNVVYYCPDGSAPNGSNQCGAGQNILWRCDSRGGEVYLLTGDWAGGTNDKLNLCTSQGLLGNFVVKACQYSYPLFDNGSGSQYTRADRFNAAYNYDPGYTDYAAGGFNGQSASGPAFCMNGQGCPAGMRAIFGEAPIRYGTNGGSYNTMQLLCVNVNLIGQTGPNSPLFTIAGGRSGSYVGDRKCGDNPGGGTAPLSGYSGSITVVGDQYGNNHEEVVWLCARGGFNAYSTTTQVCPASHPTDTGDGSGTPCAGAINNTGSNYTIDINTGISACTPSRNNLNSGDTFNCTFNLSGSPIGTYTVPSEGLYGGIRNTSGNEGTFLGNSSLCTVAGTVLTCNNLPTTGASIGTKEIIIHQPLVNWYPNKGTIVIATNYSPTGDTDNDGIPNGTECNQTGTNCPDTDGDTIPDYLDPDSDNDGILDKDERGSTCTTLTSCTPIDTDGDGKPDYRDTDSENDGVWDLIEGNDGNKDGKNDLGLTADATGKINGFADTNKDGVDDRLAGKTNTLQDTDNDGKKDFVDDNDDNDSVPTKFEDKNNNGNWADDDTNNNGIPAYLDPAESPDNRIADRILIPQSALTETPNPATGLKVFGTTDYTLVLKDDRLVEGGKTATCDFRMKEVTAVDGATDTVNVALGYNNVTATTASIVALNNGGSLTTDAQKYFRVNYNSTTTNTGVSIKFPLAKQIRTDYNIQIRCKRSDNQEFARDQKVNFKFGAYSLVTVGAEQR